MQFWIQSLVHFWNEISGLKRSVGKMANDLILALAAMADQFMWVPPDFLP